MPSLRYRGDARRDQRPGLLGNAAAALAYAPSTPWSKACNISSWNLGVPARVLPDGSRMRFLTSCCVARNLRSLFKFNRTRAGTSRRGNLWLPGVGVKHREGYSLGATNEWASLVHVQHRRANTTRFWLAWTDGNPSVSKAQNQLVQYGVIE